MSSFVVKDLCLNLSREELGSYVIFSLRSGCRATIEDVSDYELSGIKDNSRKIEQDNIFVAIAGHNQTGLRYISDALKRGCGAILVENTHKYNEVLSYVDEEVLRNTLSSRDILIFFVENIRKVSSMWSSIFYPSDSVSKLMITGTNGKTSTVSFISQLLELQNEDTATIGTLGLNSKHYTEYIGLTTPSGVELHRYLNRLQEEFGTKYVALEASSHGLYQHRLDYTFPEVVGFTNLSQDHLDFHGDLESYFQAKKILFDEICSQNKSAVINADDEYGRRLITLCLERGMKVITYGMSVQADFQITNLNFLNDGISFELINKGKVYSLKINILGDFQVYNVICALLCVYCLGSYSLDDLLALLGQLHPVIGRMQYIGSKYNGAKIYVDYAHTPDALYKALKSLKGHCSGRLISVFGCGGQRDTSKRAIMGDISSKLADVSVVTDDNPRNEEPRDIRTQILSGCWANSQVIDIGNRKIAIDYALDIAREKDLILVAGKGHEIGQIIENRIIPFADSLEIKKSLLSFNGGIEKNILWEKEQIIEALQSLNAIYDCDDNLIHNEIVNSHSSKAFLNSVLAITSVEFSSKDVTVGSLFIALKGKENDGHSYLKDAFEKGASLGIAEHRPDNLDKHYPLILVNDTSEVLNLLAKYKIQNSSAIKIAVSGSVAKTSVKDLLGEVLTSENVLVNVSERSYNNETGVPLSLARMNYHCDYVIQEMGMNHAGELRKLSSVMKPDIAILTTIGSAHIENFASEPQIVLAKSELFESLDSDKGIAIIPKDIEYYNVLEERVKELKLKNYFTFSTKDKNSNFYLERVEELAENRGQKLSIKVDVNYRNNTFKDSIELTIPFYGKHYAYNVVAAYSVLYFVANDINKINSKLLDYRLPKGRGDVNKLEIKNKEITLINDSYNANLLSVLAGLEGLSYYGERGNRILVFSEMLELGKRSEDFHAKMGDSIIKLYPKMVVLIVPREDCYPFNKLIGKLEKKSIIFTIVKDISKAYDLLISCIDNGDVVYVKGSNLSGASGVVNRLLDS